MIENVGNLVCPAMWDLGERAKIAILSVTGARTSRSSTPTCSPPRLMVLTKVDLLPHLDFDVAQCIAFAQRVNPDIEVLLVSARTGAAWTPGWTGCCGRGMNTPDRAGAAARRAAPGAGLRRLAEEQRRAAGGRSLPAVGAAWRPVTPEACIALERSNQALVAAAGGPIEAVAHDLHPDFHSTRLALHWAERLGVPAIGVQHHQAHLAVLQAEAGLVDGPLLGLALDGVGLGWTAPPGAASCCGWMRTAASSGSRICRRWRCPAAMSRRGSRGGWSRRCCMRWGAATRSSRVWRRWSGGGGAGRADDAGAQAELPQPAPARALVRCGGRVLGLSVQQRRRPRQRSRWSGVRRPGWSSIRRRGRRGPSRSRGDGERRVGDLGGAVGPCSRRCWRWTGRMPGLQAGGAVPCGAGGCAGRRHPRGSDPLRPAMSPSAAAASSTGCWPAPEPGG